jgi:hypothetical protein
MAAIRIPKRDPEREAAAARALTTPRPTFTPGALDEQGVQDLTTLNYNTQSGLTGIMQTYQDIIAGINARRPQVEQEKRMGLRDTSRSHAARGTIRSGMKVEDDTRVQGAATAEQLDLTNQGIRAGNQYQRDTDRTLADYQGGASQGMIDSNVREYQKWLERNPVTVDVNSPDVLGPPETTVPGWQNKPNQAMIQKRFGAAARAVKRGPKVGGWTVKV